MEREFKLESIELYNIFNYRGRHFIDFTPRKNGNIFLFDIKNGGGKTSLFLSIKWGFYGFNNDIRYEKDGIILGSQDFMNQDEHADGHFSRRKWVFTAGFPKYEIKRSLSDRVVRERDSEANTVSFSKEASQRQFL